jgi:hypothetical protein
MARDIDDVIGYVEKHPRFSEVLTELVRLRLEPAPTKEEIQAAKESLLAKKASTVEEAWEQRPDAPPPLPPAQQFVDASDDEPPPPSAGGPPGERFGPFTRGPGL